MNMLVGVLLAALMFGFQQDASRTQAPQPAAGPPPDLPRYVEVTPLIGTGGQPSEAGFRQLAEKGYRAIVNMRAPGEEGLDFLRQRRLAEDLGMRYYHIPMSGKEPGEQPVDQFLELMGALKDERVFVHCHSGNRIGAVMTCKRVLRDGVPAEQAEAEARRIGLRTEVLQKFARDYIEKHRGVN